MTRPGFIDPIRRGAGMGARCFGVPEGGVNRGRAALLKVSENRTALRPASEQGRAGRRVPQGRRLRSVGSGDEEVDGRRWR